jgi:signal transduction histidine kinase
MLDDLGLAPALQWQVEEFTRRSGIQADLTEEGVEDALPDLVKTCIYRIVQEALNNCEKHACASRVRLVLRQEPGEFSLQVRDDGCGFRLDAAGKPRDGGLGLLGMRERVARLEGEFRLESSPGAGTAIAVRIPLAAARSAGVGA